MKLPPDPDPPLSTTAKMLILLLTAATLTALAYTLRAAGIDWSDLLRI